MIRRGFTLIELIITIALIALIATVLVVVLNPATLLKHSRDSRRFSDIATLNKALALFQSDVSSSGMGSSTRVYVSLPDSSSTCSNLGLPTLPTGYTYSCVTTSTLQNINGTGWIPVNLSLLSSGSPLSSLPIDPTNTTTTGLYYTYIPSSSSFVITVFPEAAKYRLGGSDDITSKDGGLYPELLEKGPNLALNPVSRDPTLFLYWPLNEGTGTSIQDASGNNRTASMTYRPGINPTAWVSGKSSWGFHDGGYNYSNDEKVGMPSTKYGDAGNPPQQTDFTISFWFRPDTTQPATTTGVLAGRWWGGAPYYVGYAVTYKVANQKIGFDISSDGLTTTGSLTSSSTISSNTWYNITAVHQQGQKMQLYLNGVLDIETSYTGGLWQQSPSFSVGCNTNNGSCNGAGIFDEIRVWNRALSSNEVLALYNAQ